MEQAAAFQLARYAI